VEVEIGKEALRCENGAFSYYGMPALIPPLPSGKFLQAIYDSRGLNEGYREDNCSTIRSGVSSGWFYYLSDTQRLSACGSCGKNVIKRSDFREFPSGRT